MEEQLQHIYPSPAHRNHSVRRILDSMQSAFSSKFQNAMIQWTTQSLSATIHSNLQIVDNLVRNIVEDLTVNGLAHIAQCISRIKEFNEHAMKWMVKTVGSVNESNAMLLKGKSSADDSHNSNQCKVCFRRLEEVRLKNIRDKLQKMNHFQSEPEPDVRELYTQHEQLTFERMNAFDSILSELIMRRDTMMTLNNDRTVFVLEDFLKTMMKQDHGLEADSTDFHLLAKFRNGKEIVNQLYKELTSQVKDLTKKDVMPLVLKLSQEFAQTQREKRKKRMRAVACQTIPQLNQSFEKKSHQIKRNSSPSHRLQEQKNQHRNSSTSSIEENHNEVGRISINVPGATAHHRLSTFKIRKNHSQNHSKPIRLSAYAEDDTQSIQEENFEQIGIQADGSDNLPPNPPLDFSKFKQQAVQTTDLKQFMSTFPLPYRPNKNFNKQQALLTSLLTADKNTNEENEIDIMVSPEQKSNQIDQQNQQMKDDKVKTQKLHTKSKKDKIKRTKQVKKSKQKGVKQVIKPDKLKTTATKLQVKKQYQNYNRTYIKEKRFITEPNQNKEHQIVHLDDLHKYENERYQLAKINHIMTRRTIKKQQINQNKELQEKKQLKDKQKETQKQESEEKPIGQTVQQNQKQPAKNKNIRLQIQASSIGVRQAETLESYLSSAVQHLRNCFSPQRLARKVAQLIIYMKNNKNWVEDVDIIKILQSIRNSRVKVHRPSLKSQNDQSRIFQSQKVVKQKSNRQKPVIFGENETLRINRSEIQSLFKTSVNRKFFASVSPSLPSQQKQSAFRLPNLIRAQTESDLNNSLTNKSQKTVTNNLIKTEQNEMNLQNSNHSTKSKSKSRRGSRNFFLLEDLDIFGGLAGAYHFETIFTKNSIKKKTSVLADSQTQTLCKNICQVVYNHLENIRHTSRVRYQCIKSFLRYPYQTVCNDFVLLEANQSISLSSLQQVFGALLKLHKQCSEANICEHIQSFLIKIGLSLDISQNTQGNLNSLGDR